MAHLEDTSDARHDVALAPGTDVQTVTDTRQRSIDLHSGRLRLDSLTSTADNSLAEGAAKRIGLDGELDRRGKRNKGEKSNKKDLH